MLIVLFMLIVVLLYEASPNAKRPFRWVSPGSIIAVLSWVPAGVGGSAMPRTTCVTRGTAVGS